MAIVGKSELRETVRARRRAFVAALPPAITRLAFRALPSPALAHIPENSRIALYHARGSEAPTENLAEDLYDSGHGLCLPRLRGDESDMDFAAWDLDQILIPGPKRMLQPGSESEAVDPDVIIAPLIAFDRQFNRLGQGGGYYDRAFARWPDAMRIGLAWSVQEVDLVPTEAWDMRLHIVITEREIIERSSA